MIPSLTSCKQGNEEQAIDSSKKNIKYNVAMVETTSNIKKSKITYYDENLHPVHEQKLKYAELGGIFSNEVYVGGEVFLIPRGLMKSSGEHKVVSVNQKNGKITEYPIDRSNIQALTADTNYIYAGSNSGGISYVTQYDRKTKQVKEREFPSEFVEVLASHKDKLYAFSGTIGKQPIDNSYIYIYDKNLNLEKKMDISSIGKEPQKYIFFKNKLIFSIDSDSLENRVSKLGILDLNDQKITTLDLKEDYPADIMVNGDKLIVAHTSLVQPQGTKISVVSLKERTSEVHDLRTPIQRIAVTDNKLYVLGQDKLGAYDITKNFKKINEVSNILTYGQYASTLFVEDKP